MGNKCKIGTERLDLSFDLIRVGWGRLGYEGKLGKVQLERSRIGLTGWNRAGLEWATNDKAWGLL